VFPNRKKLNFTLEGIDASKSSVKRLESFKARIVERKKERINSFIIKNF